jgi:hypothetical protein
VHFGAIPIPDWLQLIASASGKLRISFSLFWTLRSKEKYTVTIPRLTTRWGRAVAALVAAVLATSALFSLTALPAVAAAYSRAIGFQVTDPDGNGVENAIVRITPIGGSSADSVDLLTGSDGVLYLVDYESTFDLVSLWTVQIMPPDGVTKWAAEYWDGKDAAATELLYLEPSGSGDIRSVQFDAPAPATLSGKVVSSIDPAFGIAGVSISLTETTSGEGVTEHTDVNGDFDVTVPAGTYTAGFASDASATSSSEYPFGFASPEDTEAFSLAAGEAQQLNMPLMPNGQIAGSVAGLVDGEPSAIADVAVALFDTDGNQLGGFPSAFSDENGSYSFAAAPGSYKVGFGSYSSMFSLEQAYDRVASMYDAATVIALPNLPTTGIDALYGYVDPSSIARVSGIVRSPTDQAVLPTTYVVYSETSTGEEYRAVTAQDGSYSLTLAPGRYVTNFDNYSTSASFPYGLVPIADGQEVELAGGDVRRDDRYLYPYGAISGSIVELVDGEPVAVSGDAVALFNGRGDRLSADPPVLSAEDGSYILRAAPGSYVVGFGDYSSMFSLKQAYDRVDTIEAAAGVSVMPGLVTTGIDALYGYVPGTAAVEAGTPTIVGSPLLGETLTVAPGVWSPSDVEFQYQWLRNGRLIVGGNGADYRLTAKDLGSSISARVTGFAGLLVPTEVFTAGTALVTDPRPGSVSVTVTDDAGAPLASARVSLSDGATGLFAGGETNPQGFFSASGVTAATYSVTVHSADAAFLSFTGELVVEPGAATNYTAQLRRAVAPPTGTFFSPSRSVQGGLPSVFAGQDLYFSTVAAPNATSARYSVAFTSGAESVTGALAERQGGTYYAEIPGLRTSGTAVVTTTFEYASGAVVTVDFDLYIDPSGTVVDQYGTPVSGATVTVSRSETEGGVYTAIPDGSLLLSPANRTNPATTGIDGQFGWDVVAGWYRVTATKSGVSFTTEALPVPPEQLGLILPLEFPGLAAPVPTTAPSISGTAAVGSVLSAVAAVWPAVDNEPSAITQSYQWTRDGVAIAGATGAGYTVVAADAGTSVGLVVTAGRAGYTSFAISAGAVAVPAVVVPPVIVPPVVVPPVVVPPVVVPPVVVPPVVDTPAEPIVPAAEVVAEPVETLAATGAEISGAVLAALWLLAIGAVAVATSRRRRGESVVE